MVLKMKNTRQKKNSPWKYTNENILSVIVAYKVNIFQLLVKNRRNESICEALVIMAFAVNISQLSIKY
jgi:hypothetical protein